jgi:hypothetical protein
VTAGCTGGLTPDLLTARRNSGVKLQPTTSVEKRKHGRAFVKFVHTICQENVTRDKNLSLKNPTLTINLKSASE